MFKLLTDTFIINEVINSISSEALLENELSISDSLPGIEKIISTEGKIKINSVVVVNDKVTVNGQLIFNIIYRTNHDEISVCSMSGSIPFSEDIEASGSKEKMSAKVNSYIDYIDSEMLTERTFSIKAVALIDVDVINIRPIDYIASMESDESFQAKSKNIIYSDIVSNTLEEVTINDAVELNKSSDEIAAILKADADVYITNIDVMNERMLVEGMCKVGFLYTENNSLGTTAYVSEEFPFTHYIEVKNANDNMLRNINVYLRDLAYNAGENYDNEKKLIEFKADFDLTACLYDTIEKNIIMDGYSTESDIKIESAKVNLDSIRNIKNSVMKFENNFDVTTGIIKDIYSVNIIPKVSDKRIFDDKYIIEGFLDVNLLYLNGEINKIDSAYASMPFTATIELDDEEKDCDINSALNINKGVAYRKGNNSVVVNCDINTEITFRKPDELVVISDISEVGPIDFNKMPSLIFRVVQSGETLWDIAKNYNVSINYLKKLNEIDDDILTPGSKVIIARRV